LYFLQLYSSFHALVATQITLFFHLKTAHKLTAENDALPFNQRVNKCKKTQEIKLKTHGNTFENTYYFLIGYTNSS
jgi:hypothetical protein